MEDPTMFSEYGVAYRRMATKLLDDLWPNLTWTDTKLPALDVGCGPGDLNTQTLLPRLPPSVNIVASDVNPAMVQHARQRNANPRVTSYEVLDLMDDDVTKSAVWKYAPFGKVFGVMVLHWVPDNRRAIRNIYRLLAPGGEAVFTLMARCPMFDVYDAMAKTERWSSYMKDAHKFISPYQYSKDPANDLRKIFLEESFEVVKVRAEPRAYVFSSDSETRGALMSVNAFVSRIPENLREEFMDDFLNRCYEQKTLVKMKDENTGKTKIDYKYLGMEAVARKPSPVN